jgi:serine/threonine protein kinase
VHSIVAVTCDGVRLCKQRKRVVATGAKLHRHPNVVTWIDVVVGGFEVAIIMELAKGGSLRSFLKSRGGRLSEAEARPIVQQITAGLCHCHSLGIAHRDLKLENWVLGGDSNSTVKLIDFGLSKADDMSSAKTAAGTVAYLAPEIVAVVKQAATYDGQKVDIWSTGVLLYVLVVGELPFGYKPTGTVLQRIVARDVKPFPSEISPSFVRLFDAMTALDPNSRPSSALLQEISTGITPATVTSGTEALEWLAMGGVYDHRECLIASAT